MIGLRFGRLTVTASSRRDGRTYLSCACDCGRDCSVRRDHLRSGRTSSCGCWHDEAASIVNTVHGHKTRLGASAEYRAWCGMVDRCHREANPRYADYGGRGIRVCAEWRNDFRLFLSHVGPRPAPGLSIDRVRVDGNYEPGNVRWADRKTQARNVRNRKLIHAFGRAQSLAEWSDETGIDKKKIHNRLNELGWAPELAVSL